jgi:arabinofuranosyltransferase
LLTVLPTKPKLRSQPGRDRTHASAMTVKPPALRHLAALLLSALFAFVVVRTAWVSDDAFIGLRSVANLVEGNGFVWNVGERVQTYTAPLWTLSVAGITALTGDPWLATLALAFAASLIAFAILVWKVAPSAWPALFGGLVLILSKAFTDFSTGGLENPFTHLFVLLGWLALTSGEPGDRRTLWRFAIVAGLATTNRLDTVLLFAPALGWLAYRVGIRRSILPIAVGFLPVVAWILFSIVYYGFPFPNTAYAKAFGHGLDRLDLLRQGLYYLDDSRQRDPITLCMIASGLLVSLAVGPGRRRAFAFGAALYVAYVIWIGGDYMSGRFLTAPLVVTVAALASFRFDQTRAHTAYGALGVALALILGAAFVPCRPTVLSGPHYEECLPKIHGITDERGFYYGKGLGLFSPARRDPVADHENNPFRGRKLVVWNMMGYASFVADRETHMIDLFGLGDPILARLPCHEKIAPGHYRRSIPAGYLRTLATGENSIVDPELHEYFDKLHFVQAGPIWSEERLQVIVGFLFGRYDHLLRSYVERHESGPRRITFAELPEPLAPDTPWYDEGVVGFDHDGLRVTLPELSHATKAHMVFGGNDQYAVAFVRSEELDAPGFQPVPHALLPPTPEAVQSASPAMVGYDIEIPGPVSQAGFDTVLVVPAAGDNIFGIGGLTFEE